MIRKSKTKSYPDNSYEKEYWKRNLLVAGIDEAGRGPLAGPVVAAAVVLRNDFPINIGINDSKLLNEKLRDEYYQLIQNEAIAVGVCSVDNSVIDDINILKSTMLAMEKAVDKLKVKPEHLLIDGNYYKNKVINYTTIVYGDSKSISIAAASIIAKVTRDKWMTNEADKLYPEYEFAKHKGYATAKHIELIKKYGACPIHRRSFLKKIIDINSNIYKNIIQMF